MEQSIPNINFTELPPYRRGSRKCPDCGSTRLMRAKLHPSIVLPFPPRLCTYCGAIWTPRPPRALAVVYATFGGVMLLTAFASPILIVAIVRDLMRSSDFKVGYLIPPAVFLIGGPIAFLFGRAHIKTARHIWNVPAASKDPTHPN